MVDSAPKAEALEALEAPTPPAPTPAANEVKKEADAVATPAAPAVSQEAKISPSKMKLEMDVMDDGDGGVTKPLSKDATSDTQTAASSKSGCAEQLCACCGQETRVPKCIYGPECKKALNNIDKQEATATNPPRSGPRWKRWQETKRQGGPKLNGVIMAYRKTCQESQGSGKSRGKYDFVRSLEEMKVSTEVAQGSKLRYMTLARWLTHAQEEFDMSVTDAEKDWTEAERVTPASLKRQTKSGLLRLPMPYEEYITGEDAVQHSKALVVEEQHKKVNKETLGKLEKQTHLGQFGFNDAPFEDVGGRLFSKASCGEKPLFSGLRFGDQGHVQDLGSLSGGVPDAPAGAGEGSSSAGSGVAASVPRPANPGPEPQPKPQPKRAKRYDVAANQNKLNERIEQDLMAACKKLLTEVEGEKDKIMGLLTNADLDKYHAYIVTMKARACLVRMVLSTDSDAEEKLRRHMEDLKSKQEPMPVEGAITCLSTAQASLKQKVREGKDEDSMKLVQNELKGSVAMFKRLSAAASRAASDLKKALEARKRKAAVALQKEAKAEERQRTKEEKEVAKAVKLAKNGTETPCLWLPQSTVGHLQKDLVMVKSLADLLTESKRDASAIAKGEPFCVEDASSVQKYLTENTELAGIMQVFEAQYPMSRQAKERQRAQTPPLGCNLLNCVFSFLFLPILPCCVF